MDRVPLTPPGFARLKAELAELKAERPRISQEIGTAAAHGDLRENAEYHAAREKQGMNEARIAVIEDQIARAEIIDPVGMSGDRIKFGATVELEETESGKAIVYQIVGSEEADITGGKISITSPVARALINREVGDEVKIQVPGGMRSFEITAVRWV